MDLQVTTLHNPPIDEVTYLVWREDWPDYLAIDPYGYERIVNWQEEHDKRCAYILLTHEHYDHIGAAGELRQQEGCRIIASAACSAGAGDPRHNLSAFYDALMELHGIKEWEPVTDRYVLAPADLSFQGVYEFCFHDIPVRLVETPGHSPGSICIELAEYVFTGDSLLRDTPVITRCPYGSRRDYKKKTLPYLQSVSKDKMIYPGHGEPFLMRDSRYI